MTVRSLSFVVLGPEVTDGRNLRGFFIYFLMWEFSKLDTKPTQFPSVKFSPVLSQEIIKKICFPLGDIRH